MSVLAAAATMMSGCFATRMVRTDTSYDVVRAEAPPNAMPSIAIAPPPAPEGTLVVEALVVPPPPAAGTVTLPVRLPSAVAAATDTVPSTTRVPGWDPLPSYVAQYAGPGWQHRPMYGGGTQSSSGFRRWGGRSAGPMTGASSVGGVGSASPHFSSSPSFSGSASSHFSSPPSFSGF